MTADDLRRFIMGKFFITTAIDYVNGPPHFGHALEKVQADTIARYERLLGKEVYFLTGADEHGMKIVRSAEEAKKSVKDFSDENVEKFKKLIKGLNISNDDFIRTSDKERHWTGARALWGKLVEAGDIYKGTYKGCYCVGCEAYVTEKDLVGGKCPYHGKEPELIEEENYFFKLSRYAGAIGEKIISGEMEVIPAARKNEILSMIERGAEDISFSRPAEKLEGWGVPVPGDESQLMYVWCDALSNYISALGYGSGNPEKFNRFWPADIHLIGKDILRFHALVWPAMLLSAGLPVPRKIMVHGFVLSGGKRMSKSSGNVIDPFDLIEKYGTDAVRYYLLREISPFEDGDITEEKFKDAYNANLANGLGNLTARIMKMSEQHLAGEAPGGDAPVRGKEALGVELGGLMENLELNRAMDGIWESVSKLDSRIQETKPFNLVKTDKDAAKKILREMVAELKKTALMLAPFLPETSQKMLSAIKHNKMPEPLFLRA